MEAWIGDKSKCIDNFHGMRTNNKASFLLSFRMAAPEVPANSFCNCASRPPLIGGWEGSATLEHGYLLNFGCESFVFVIPTEEEE